MNTLKELRWGKKAVEPRLQSTAQRLISQPGRTNLLRLPWMRFLLESRWPITLARGVTLAGFIFTLTAGLLGPRVGDISGLALSTSQLRNPGSVRVGYRALNKLNVPLEFGVRGADRLVRHPPHRFQRGRIVRQTWNDVPVDVRELVAEEFVVDFFGVIGL